MALQRKGPSMSKPLLAIFLWILTGAHAAAAATAEPQAGEVAKADKARNKPLQRCDQLGDKAELDCLHKARERIVEARRKREAAAGGGDAVKK